MYYSFGDTTIANNKKNNDPSLDVFDDDDAMSSLDPPIWSSSETPTPPILPEEVIGGAAVRGGADVDVGIAARAIRGGEIDANDDDPREGSTTARRRPPPGRDVDGRRRRRVGRPAFLRPMIARRGDATTTSPPPPSDEGVRRDEGEDGDGDEDGDGWPRRCALVRADGSIANADAGSGGAGGGRCHYAYAICARPPPGPTMTESRYFADDGRQMGTVARLSARCLTGGGPRSSGSAVVPAVGRSSADSHSPSDNARGAGIWLGGLLLPTSLARAVGRGVGRAIDAVLAAYEGDEDYYPGMSSTTGGGRLHRSDGMEGGRGGESDDDVSSSDVRRMLAMDVASTPDIALDGGVERGTTTTEVEFFGMGRSTDDDEEEEAIDLEGVASACRHLLAFARLLVDGGGEEEGGGDDRSSLFVPRVRIRHHARGCGDAASGRVMMLNGTTAGRDGDCSFGSLCRRAGGRLLRGATTTTTTDDGDRGGVTHDYDSNDESAEERRRVGEILEGVSEEDADLLVRTLVESGRARIEGNVLTMYPGGVPADRVGANVRSSSTTDEALFRIHVTRIALRERMARLERDADVAGEDAVRSRASGKAGSSALAHMRRRKLALAESERCASVLVNLDASELALERAEDDADVVRSYASARDALRALRESGGLDGDGVDDLMADMKDEMDEMAICLPGGEEDAHDDDELNDEFRRLELECEADRRRPEEATEGTSEKGSDLSAIPTIGRRGAVSESSRSEAVPA